jgi:2-methylcitrate dehydratase PrpD
MASEASLTERLAQRLALPVAAPDRARAAWSLLDWLACALVGRNSPAGQALARVVAKSPPGPCWLAGFTEHRGQAADAAFLHGGLGSVFELDDLHRAAIVHPGDTVIPAALAVAQREQADASALLSAIVRGYEAAIVVGRLAGPRHYRHWYSTATCGVFGAAAAAASLLRLSPEATADALGLAGMQASGPWQCREEPGFAKQLATAHAARSGVCAADMALSGLIGPRRVLEGRHGLLAATGASLEVEPASAFASACVRAWAPAPIRPTTAASRHADSPEDPWTLATGPWQIHDVSFKPWPACRHVHPAIEAALELRARLGLKGGDGDAVWNRVASIQIETYSDAIAFADRPNPTTDHEARFSLQHAVAVALIRGDFTLADAGAEARDDPQVKTLRAKTAVQPAPRFDAAYPARFGGAVTVNRSPGVDAACAGKSGAAQPPTAQAEAITATVDAALGDPEHPMPPARLLRKAATLFDAARVAPQTGQRLIDACLALARDPAEENAPSRGLQPFWVSLQQEPRADGVKPA